VAHQNAPAKKIEEFGTRGEGKLFLAMLAIGVTVLIGLAVWLIAL
jgi:hypothetical protein